MKKILLLGLAGAFVAASASATDVTAVKTNASVQQKNLAVQRNVKVLKSEKLSSKVEKQVVADEAGRVFKRLVVSDAKPRVNVNLKGAPQRDLAEGEVLNEGFEGYDPANEAWLPDGWSLRRLSNREDAGTWGILPDPAAAYVAGFNGAAMSINFDSNFLDEWLVTPEFTVRENMELSFNAINDGVWYFSMENVDWDTMSYVGDKILAYDLKVMISTDGGETWNLLKSLASDFMEDDLMTLYNDMTSAAKKLKISLAEYAGKNVKIGFEYVGTDGQTGVIDDVRVALPELELSYQIPTGGLYYGMSKDSYTLNHSILCVPVFQPVTWTNMSYNEGATYAWRYFDSDNEWKTSTEQDALTVTFRLDYKSEFTTRNNLYYSPVLVGESAAASPGEYSLGEYSQAGGKAEFMIKDEEGQQRLTDFGMGVVDPLTEGFSTFTDKLVPIFGYSGDSDNYWTSYTFGEDAEPTETDWVKMTNIMNFFTAGESPLVINGVWVSAFGKISDGARFKAEVVALNEDFTPGEVLASAECAGSDVDIIVRENASTDFLSVPFTFAEPLVMSSDVCDYYVVRFSGFNDPANVEYFSPILSEKDSPSGMAFGWIGKEICNGGEVRESMTAVYGYTGVLQSFYIQLDGHYAWLQGGENAEIVPGETVSHPLDSYHPGEKLSVENLPAWLTASVSGRYGETKLNLTASADAPVNEETTVMVKGAGVSHDVKVKVNPSGVFEIGADNAEVEAIYTLQGVRVANADAAGIYLVKLSNGKVVKAVKK